MKATHRVYAHLELFNDEMGGLRAEMAEFRTETAKNFVRLEGDLITLENQNMSRHGEP